MFVQALLTLILVLAIFLILWKSFGKWFLNEATCEISNEEIEQEISDLKKKQVELEEKRKMLEDLKEEREVTLDLARVEEDEIKVRDQLERAEKIREKIKKQCKT